MGKRACIAGILAMLMIIMLSGCYSVYTGERYNLGQDLQEYEQQIPDGVTLPVFYGYGTGSSKASAEDRAVLDAMHRAIVLALGDSALVYREQVLEILEDQLHIDDFILSSSLTQIDYDYDDGIYSMLVSVRIILPELSQLLRDEGITGGLIQDSISLRLPDQEPLDYDSAQSLSRVLGAVGVEWGSGYKPTFLVYYDEEQAADPFTARTAVLIANDYLSTAGFTYIDLKQIETIKSDQEYAFAEETGETSMLRWIASKLHADYYIDVAVNTSSYARGGKYYADSSVSMSCFNASTAEGRGSVFIQTDEPVQANTRSSALDGAVAQGVNTGMKQIMGKASEYFTEDAERGNSYDLIIMKTYDDKVLRAFQNALKSRVSSLIRTSFSVEESQYSLEFTGNVDELADIIYETAEMFPELKDMYLIYQRGDSLTFHSGM